MSTSQGSPAADASLDVTYRTISGCPEDARTFYGYVLKTSLGCTFPEWVTPCLVVTFNTAVNANLGSL